MIDNDETYIINFIKIKGRGLGYNIEGKFLTLYMMGFLTTWGEGSYGPESDTKCRAI